MKSKRVWCFSLVIVAVFSLGFWFLNDASAACNSDGYCYGTGRDPLGGLCGASNNTGVYWDTCYGLSWQYYNWPTGYTGNINFPGSNNAGHATVSSQCADYDGFWFLGYEAYQPSTGRSYGYQVGRPKAGMLSARGGYTPLYYSESVPSPNPSIQLQVGDGYVRLSGTRYANAETMRDEIEVLFNKYAQDGTLISSNSGDQNATFNDINWFCARDEDDKTVGVAGRVTVTAGGTTKATGWNSPSEADAYVTINEGETANVAFSDIMKSDGARMVTVGYTINGDFVGAQAETGYYQAFEGVTDEEIVGSHSMNVTTSGKYCEILSFKDPETEADRIMTACAVVTVVPAPPDVYGRIGVEATIYDKDGNVKDTVALDTTPWNDTSDPPLTKEVHLGSTDTATVHFIDSMKGQGNTSARIEFITTNTAYPGEQNAGTFEYDSDNPDTATVVKETTVNDANHVELICETLRFGDPEQSVVACANITRDEEEDLTRQLSGNGGFDFGVEVDLKLAVSLSNRLITDSGTNGTFLRDSTTLGVSTNSNRGFDATLTTDKNSTDVNATDLKHNYKDNLIHTLDQSVTRANFPEDKWGYSIDDTDEGDAESTYNPMVAMDSVSPIMVLTSDRPATESQDIYFATKMSALQPTGVYSNSIVFRVVAKVTPETPMTIDDIEYMQDINDEVIASMAYETQYQLTDKRDGKKYWVTKLLDKQVIMTQNLDFELKKGDVLTSSLTDIGYGDENGANKTGRSYWVVDESTRDSLRIPWAYRGVELDNISSIEFGQGNNGWISGKSYRASSDPMVGMLSPYLNDYFLGAAGLPAHYIDDADCAASTEFTEEECAHGKAGVIYNWAAASAGAGIIYNNINNFEGTTVTDSVCPKEWRLPSYADDYRFYYNFGQYYTPYVGDGSQYVMREAPLYMIGTPTIEHDYYQYYFEVEDDGEVQWGVKLGTTRGALSYTENTLYAHYWVAQSTNGVSNFAMSINPAYNNNDHWWGTSYKAFSIRCMARYGN